MLVIGLLGDGPQHQEDCIRAAKWNMGSMTRKPANESRLKWFGCNE